MARAASVPICRLSGSEHKASAIGEIGHSQPSLRLFARPAETLPPASGAASRSGRRRRRGQACGPDETQHRRRAYGCAALAQVAARAQRAPARRRAPTMDRRSLTRPRGALIREPLARTIERPDAHLATGRDGAALAQEPCSAPPAGIVSGGSGKQSAGFAPSRKLDQRRAP